jgi:uncharacterized membrane protein
MTMIELDGIVDDYLHQLGDALRTLPASERDQIVAEITEHISQARAELPDQSEASIRGLLDRVGDPEVIAASALGDEVAPKALDRRVQRRLGRRTLVLLGALLLALAGLLIFLEVNGSSGVAMPNVVGQSANAATSEIMALGVHEGGIVVAPSATIAPGNVIATVPEAGATIPSGGAVKLIVSGGTATVTVPNLVGLRGPGAMKALRAAGLLNFAIATVHCHQPSSAPGVIYSQTPAAFSIVKRGSGVLTRVCGSP